MSPIRCLNCCGGPVCAVESARSHVLPIGATILQCRFTTPQKGAANVRLLHKESPAMAKPPLTDLIPAKPCTCRACAARPDEACVCGPVCGAVCACILMCPCGCECCGNCCPGPQE